MAKKDTDNSENVKPERSEIEAPEVLAIESIDDVIETKHAAGSHLAVNEKKNPVRRFGIWYWSRKRWTVPLSILLIIAVLLAVPTTRYLMTGWFWKESITIVAVDAANGRPVSEATVTIAGQTAKTDAKGRAQLKSVAVGTHTLSIDKRYYQIQTTDITVPWFAQGKEFSNSMTATGRSVQVSVMGRIGGKAIEGALVSIVGENNQARTDATGKATIIIPADKKEMSADITAEGFNKAQVTLKQDVENIAQLVPVGKMYFLSKQSGKLDVVRTNLDGSDRKIVLAGTGHENDNTTSLLASTDWKYLALRSQREAGKPEVLTLITTADDSSSVFDQGNASFDVVGWSGHQFIYNVTRSDVEYWKAKRQAIKTLDADTKKLATVDESTSEGDSAFGALYETFDNTYIIGDNLTYTKRWWPGSYSNNLIATTEKQASIMLVRSDGINKKAVKTFPVKTLSTINGKLYRPDEVYFQVTLNDSANKPQYFELEDGSVKSVADGVDAFNKAYPAYLISPSGDRTFWAESRDGKNALFVGDKHGENGEQLALQSEFKAYGWLTDSYLLLQKKDSELYIATKDRLKAGVEPVKISDYHKLVYGPTGYGSGYGGQ